MSYVVAARPSAINYVVNQSRIILALILRQMKLRSKEARLGYLLQVIEPAIIIFVISTAMEWRRGVPPVGPNFATFFATGVLPYKAFLKINSGMRAGLSKGGELVEMPAIQQLHMLLSTLALNTLTMLLVFLLVVCGMNTIGYPVYPADMFECFEAFFWLVMLAFGFGLVAAVLRELFPAYRYIHRILTFKLGLASGVFFLPELMPAELRYYLAFNPLLHAIAWFRSGFIDGFESSVLDRGYLIWWCILLIMFGLLLVRVFRGRMGDMDDEDGEEQIL